MTPSFRYYLDLLPCEIPDINSDAIEACLKQFTLTELKSMLIFGLKCPPHLVVKEYEDVNAAISSIMCNLVYKDARLLGKALDDLIAMAKYFLRHTCLLHRYQS